MDTHIYNYAFLSFSHGSILIGGLIFSSILVLFLYFNTKIKFFILFLFTTSFCISRFLLNENYLYKYYKNTK